MNEQIQAILAENTTKTAKIQKLLALGLTRTEVARLVTNGNYGFVQNVYAKMVRQHLLEAARRGNAILPTAPYTFTRNFGIEIEANGCEKAVLARELRAAGIAVTVEGYNHTDYRDHWKLVRDGSLSGSLTFELVSPILSGEDGLRQLETVCWVLDLCGATVNDSCGLHIHMDAADFDMQTWRNLAISYKRLETVIDGFMPQSRRNNHYCKTLRNISEEAINGAQNIEQLRHAFGDDRYHKVNLEAYARHRTVEFRQHGGTVNFTKMSAWIHFLDKLVTFAHGQAVAKRTTLETIPFLTDTEKLYLKIRTKKLSA